MIKQLKILALGFIAAPLFGGKADEFITMRNLEIPKDIRIDEDIERDFQSVASWNPNKYEIQILRELQKRAPECRCDEETLHKGLIEASK